MTGGVCLTLAWRAFAKERSRFISAVCGVAAAVALLSWHVGLALMALHSGDAAARRAAAPFLAWVVGPVDEALLAKQDLRGVVSLATVTATLDVREGGRVLQGPPLRGVVAALPATGIPFEVGAIEGRLPDLASAEPEVVVNLNLFGKRVAAPAIGEPLPLVLPAGTAAPKIVGFFRMGRQVADFPSLYANPAAMATLAAHTPGFDGAPNLTLFTTVPASSSVPRRSRRGSAPRLETVDMLSARLRTDTVNNLLSSLPMTLGLAIIASACMVATVLLAGLALRRRRFAELRCAGMTRGGVARLVAWEAAVIALVGWALGTLLAALLLHVFLFLERGGDLPATPYLGWQTPLAGLALAVVVGATAMAAPAVAATRVKPLEALGGGRATPRPLSWRRALLPLLLLLPMPILSVLPGLGERGRAAAMAAMGIPCFVTALLLSPRPIACLVEWLFLAPLARLLCLDPALLRHRLGRDPARAAGTILTVALCLGGFIAIHVWGGTLMASFVPSPEWPDAIVSILPGGWTDAQCASAARCPGIAAGKVVKIDCSQKPFDPESPAFAGREAEIPKGQVLLFGADPDLAYGGAHPFAPFRLVAGDRDTALATLREGRGCLLVSMLARLAGLRLGDRVRFAGRELEIAGIVDLNWHMVTSRALVRTPFGREAAGARRGRDGAGRPPRTIGAVFASEAFVRGITGNEKTYFLWLNMAPELEELGGLGATVQLDAQLNAAVPPDGASAVQVHHRDEIADGTLAHGSDILGAMARIPFWSLAVAATGMVALLLASVQGALGELRMMRAVGMTRGQLGRLILGEAALVSLAALLLGFLAGLVAGWSFTGLSRWVAAAGLPVRLIVPWRTLLKGMAFALTLCMAMSLLPIRRLVQLVDARPHV